MTPLGIIEILAFAAVWGAFTWHAQASGEMIFFFAFLRRPTAPIAFGAIMAFRWLQVAVLVALAALYATGALPLR